MVCEQVNCFRFWLTPNHRVPAYLMFTSVTENYRQILNYACHTLVIMVSFPYIYVVLSTSTDGLQNIAVFIDNLHNLLSTFNMIKNKYNSYPDIWDFCEFSISFSFVLPRISTTDTPTTFDMHADMSLVNFWPLQLLRSFMIIFYSVLPQISTHPDQHPCVSHICLMWNNI